MGGVNGVCRAKICFVLVALAATSEMKRKASTGTLELSHHGVLSTSTRKSKVSSDVSNALKWFEMRPCAINTYDTIVELIPHLSNTHKRHTQRLDTPPT